MLSVNFCMGSACVREDNHSASFGNSVYPASTLFSYTRRIHIIYKVIPVDLLVILKEVRIE